MQNQNKLQNVPIILSINLSLHFRIITQYRVEDGHVILPRQFLRKDKPQDTSSMTFIKELSFRKKSDISK